MIDDSDDVRDVLTLLLEAEGYKVLPVEDGETALLMTKRMSPALITLDIRLPHQDGGEVLRRLKADPSTARIPVILISGQPNALELGDSFGADGVLAKPFDVEEVQRLISSLVPPGPQ